VSQWSDLSGLGNHATPSKGAVTYPSLAFFPSGLKGLDFGSGRNTLELFDAQESDGLLDQTGRDGFAALIAYRKTGNQSDQQDLLGNVSKTDASQDGGFVVRLSSGGVLRAIMGDVSLISTGDNLKIGDSMVIGVRYLADTGLLELYNSLGDTVETTTVAATDFSNSSPLTLGSADKQSRYAIGVIGEVKIFSGAMDSDAFQSEWSALNTKWITNETDYWASGLGFDIGSEDEDFDGDGVSNFIEYVFGGSPMDSSVQMFPVKMKTSGDTLVYSHARRIDSNGLTYQVQISPNLQPGSWMDINPSIINVEPIDNEFQLIELEIPSGEDSLLNEGDALFIRVKAVSSQETAPNILLIQADDLGYTDLGIHGSQMVQTPHLDRLGQESMRFDRFYVHPLCAPTRASLLTGKHFWRTGVYGVHGGMDFMNLDETTIAEVLGNAGYRTGMWGKWHSGKSDGYFPWDRGFDEAYMAELYEYKDNQGLLNGEPAPANGWTPAVLTDYAVDFMKRNPDKPFFAYVSYLSPHGEWAAPEEYIAPYQSAGYSKNSSTLYGMISHMDYHIGRLLNSLDDLGLRESTIVLFMSDNGPARNVSGFDVTDEEWIERMAPLLLRGKKSTVYENGIRSPLFIRWGDRLKPEVNNEILTIMDILPTLAELGGAKTPGGLDGKSFYSLLESPHKEWPERNLYFSLTKPSLPGGVDLKYQPFEKHTLTAGPQRLVVMGNGLKLLKRNGKADLFDISEDIREQNNLKSKQPEIANYLSAQADAWFERILEEPGSFTRPTMLIGNKEKKVSEFPAYCVAQTQGGLENSAFKLKNWKELGDIATFYLHIQRHGTYNFEILFEDQLSASAEFEIELAGQTTVCNTDGLEKSHQVISVNPIDVEQGETTLSIKLISPLSTAVAMSSITMKRGD
ncbi:MAG: sulfatase-like hydrolase/transferase, partial [Verrucomicrobiota bacterium]